MITNRWGDKVVIHEVFGKYHNMTLCRAVVTHGEGESKSERYKFVFAETLKADNGLNEILAVVQEHPVQAMMLTVKQLNAAIQEAS